MRGFKRRGVNSKRLKCVLPHRCIIPTRLWGRNDINLEIIQVDSENDKQMQSYVNRLKLFRQQYGINYIHYAIAGWYNSKYVGIVNFNFTIGAFCNLYVATVYHPYAHPIF